MLSESRAPQMALKAPENTHIIKGRRCSAHTHMHMYFFLPSRSFPISARRWKRTAHKQELETIGAIWFLRLLIRHPDVHTAITSRPAPHSAAQHPIPPALGCPRSKPSLSVFQPIPTHAGAALPQSWHAGTLVSTLLGLLSGQRDRLLCNYPHLHRAKT